MSRSAKRSSRSVVFLGKVVLKMRSKFTRDAPMLCNFVEVTHWHGCSPVNLPRILRIHFPKNVYEGLLLTDARIFLKPDRISI